MKTSIIVEIIKGFFDKTPKRLKLFRNIMVVVAILIYALHLLSNNGVIAPPEWIASLISPDGIIYALMVAAGLNFAKKDINEK